jgi:CHASE2 domain-containing sensor protein
MAGDDIHADIARIEVRIEELGEAIERCRKLALAAKIAIGAGAAWIVLTLAWVIPYVPYMTVAALAAVIGGIVLAGSNSTTWKQTEAALTASEAMRADMIGQLQLRVVEERPTLH